MSNENVYYRLKINVKPNGVEEVTVKKIERGEERTDNPKLYISDTSGTPYRFEEQEDAVDWLNTFVKTEYVDPQYRVPSQNKFMNRAWNKENIKVGSAI